MSNPDLSEGLLNARLFDAAKKREKGRVALLPYLTPYEKKQAERWLRSNRLNDSAFFFGGYPDAERVCLFLLPDYLCDMLSAPPSLAPTEEVLNLISDEVSDACLPILIKGSGFRELCHRDYLGSILALGIRRDAIGDLCVQDQKSAVLFCNPTIFSFLSENLVRVANDSVRISRYAVDGTFTDGRHYQQIHDTVSAPRLDCVVAALTNLSRTDAQELVKNGSVEVDFEAELRTDRILEPPCEISARGFGRFRLQSFDGTTKKDRLRMSAVKYI